MEVRLRKPDGRPRGFSGATPVSKEELAAARLRRLHWKSDARVAPSRAELAKPTAYLVNTSRAPLIDGDALLRVLEEKKIGGAALDVFDDEPLPARHPLTQFRNVLLTPHLGYVTAETYRVFYGQALEDIRAYLDGHPVRLLTTLV
jgi:lactate dehydrogenase-like 2-hydroxyacid dehydrogenase